MGLVEQTWQLLLGDVDLPLVHVVEDGPDLLVLDVLEEDDGVLAVVLHEQLLEVRGARREEDLVALDGAAVAGQGDVAERLGLQEVVEHREQVVAVVVPPQAEHLRQRVHLGDRELRQQAERGEKKSPFRSVR